MSKKRVTLQLASRSEKPTYWLTEGSRWSRKPETVALVEGDSEMRDVLPEDRDPAKDIPVLFRQVRILTPGNWNGLDIWTEGFIQASARNFNPDRPKPLQADHSRSANDNHGKVYDLMALPAMEGKPPALIGLIGVVGSYAIERLEDGRWDSFSGGWWVGATEEETEFFELSFTPFPACDDTAILTQNEEKEGTNVSKSTDNKVLQGAGAQADDTFIAQLSGFFAKLLGKPETTDNTTPVAAEPKQLTVDPDIQARLDAQDAEIASLKAAQAESAKAQLTEKVRGEVLELVREGHSAPANFEAEVELLETIPDEQRAKYLELRRSQPKVWSPTRQSDPKQALSATKRDEAKTDEDTEAIRKLMGVKKAATA